MNALALRKSNRTAKISRLLKRPTYRVGGGRGPPPPPGGGGGGPLPAVSGGSIRTGAMTGIGIVSGRTGGLEGFVLPYCGFIAWARLK
jgi:hypothetical protein